MKKGFTLIELLAVIVILAIIALIATPLVMNTINDAKDGALKSTARNIIEIAATEYQRKLIDDPNTVPSIDFSKLEYKGEKMELITGSFDQNGQVNIAIYHKGNCLIKNVGDKDVNLTKVDNASDCINQKTLAIITSKLLNQPGDNLYSYMDGTYLKGLQDNNYLLYNDILWRIMGLNEDGSVRLITHELQGSTSWGPDDSFSSYENSIINRWANGEFLSQLTKNPEYMVKQTFCNATLLDESNPSTSCPSDAEKVTTKVGYISVQEGLLSLKNVSSDMTCIEASLIIHRNWGEELTEQELIDRLAEYGVTCEEWLINDGFSVSLKPDENGKLVYADTYLNTKGLSSPDDYWLKSFFWTLTTTTMNQRFGSGSSYTQAAIGINTQSPFNEMMFGSAPSSDIFIQRRPIININSSIQILNGTGSKEDPYMIQ